MVGEVLRVSKKLWSDYFQRTLDMIALQKA